MASKAVLILSLSDILTALVYFYDKDIVSIITITLLWFHVFKGTLSLIGSLFSRYYYDWMGAIDVLSGIAVVFRGTGILTGFFHFMMILLLIKGIYTFIRGLF